MNRLVFLLTAVISFSLISIAQPKFTIVGGDEHNWGEVKPKDSPLKTSVQFKNEGNENLVMIQVKPTCGCTIAKPTKDTLKPGEVASMDVEYNVAGNTGVVAKNILIETNDPTRSKIYYKISANVIRNLICKPSDHLPFKELEVGKESTSTIYIKNNSNKEIHFSDLKVTPPIIKLTIPADFILQPNEEIEITGSLTAKDEGYISSKISMKTDDPDFPVLEIGAYGQATKSPIFNSPNKK
jgi:hypothetical protein